jgi:nicotinamide-nucleotide amidase
MTPGAIEKLARQVLEACRRHQAMLAMAESCTGGLVAAALTDIAGSSDVVERGFVTYSNEAKSDMLGVPAALIASHGAVSAEVAAAMAEGALRHAHASVAVAVTGIAGPGGGSEAKPVGLVHFAAASRAGRLVRLERRYGPLGRKAIREAATADALQLVIDLLGADQAAGGLP